MTALPDWMQPPREEGWFADDLDHLPEAPRHTELIDGALIFMMSPQREWHAIVIYRLAYALQDQAPDGFVVAPEMTIRLDKRNRPEPDIVVAANAPVEDRTWYEPSNVSLVVEVVSPESDHRDRMVKPRKYAEAGIPHYWLIENEDGQPVVHVYELDTVTATYVPADIARGVLERPVPFPLVIDLATLVRGKKSR
ncbi:Uma2 family endonuclease [Actinocrispum wychmicini]|uniref:Uma2 family endonuclease n=1 Tax=Actinocrispum wychmicini TaxID=1213861 RepID=A0A4R2JQJ3_9PSEU|nr:Uma2 family endonuclease [Actinocrispum wychmicini]TCO62501.1 Uma2 family endonuclease [Actinocrispum wychmicini]